MKLSEQIKKQADRTIKYLSKEYLELHNNIQRFAEPHILFNGFYSFRIVNSNTNKAEKVLIVR